MSAGSCASVTWMRLILPPYGKCRAIAAAVALKVDPDAPADADPYADPRYQVPDDLVW